MEGGDGFEEVVGFLRAEPGDVGGLCPGGSDDADTGSAAVIDIAGGVADIEVTLLRVVALGDDFEDALGFDGAFGGAGLDGVEVLDEVVLFEGDEGAFDAFSGDHANEGTAGAEVIQYLGNAVERRGVVGVELFIPVKVGLQDAVVMIGDEVHDGALLGGAKGVHDLGVGEVAVEVGFNGLAEGCEAEGEGVADGAVEVEDEMHALELFGGRGGGQGRLVWGVDDGAVLIHI